MKPKLLATILFSFLIVGYVSAAYEISRSTIDGGGRMQCTGDDFELSGTIGQPDAGVMLGGDFELTGGFWFALDPGDCNDDGSVNLVDTDEFAACITGPGNPIVDDSCRCFDVDRNQAVDVADFAAIQATYTGP